MNSDTAQCVLDISTEMLSAWRSHLLSAREQEHIDAHILGCPTCQRRLQRFDRIAQGLRTQHVPPSGASLWRSVQATISTSEGRPMFSTRKILFGGLGAAAVIALLVVLIFTRLGHVAGNQAILNNTLIVKNAGDLSTTTIMRYSSNDTSNAYLLGLTFNTYDGHDGWALLPPQQSHMVNLPHELVPESPFVKQVQQTIQIVNAPTGPYVYALGEPAAFSFPITAHSDGIPLNSKDQTGSYTDWQAPGAIHNGTRYTATSYVSTATAEQLRKVQFPTQAPDLYSPEFVARYLQLPDDLKDPNDASVLKGQEVIAQAHATNMYDEAVALIEYFHNTFGYTTTPGPVPSDKDVVDFLLTKPAMYCTWFATGFTMMARELGLPARVVEGFSPGSPDPRQPGIKVIKGTDTHAWSQVYFAGYGWINFEPSTGFSGPQLASKPITSTNNAPEPIRPPTTQRQKPPSSPGTTTTPKPNGTGATTTNPVVEDVTVSLSLIIALALLAVLAALAWWRIIFRGLTPIGQAFARMAFLGRFAGAKPLRSQTATEYGAALAERLPGQRPAIEEITQLYVLERWAPAAPEITPTLGERWQQLRGALVRAMLRRRPRRMRSRQESI
jgi:transglutaminase-like putative cysteine protease